MGAFKESEPGLMFVGAIAREEGPVQRAIQRFSDRWGALEWSRGPFEFSPFTSYYRAEMGEALFRWFCGFERLVDPSSLVFAKREAVALEEELSVRGDRTVNLDPGILQLAKVVLSTTKDHAHRIYLGSGVFAEVTLFYARKAWRPQPWTYPDYQSHAYLEVFDEARELLIQKIRGGAILESKIRNGGYREGDQSRVVQKGTG